MEHRCAKNKQNVIFKTKYFISYIVSLYYHREAILVDYLCILLRYYSAKESGQIMQQNYAMQILGFFETQNMSDMADLRNQL